MLFGYFPLRTHFSKGHETMQLAQGNNKRIHNVSHVLCFIIVGAHMGFRFKTEVKIFVLMKWLYVPPWSCWLLSLDWLVYYEHVVVRLVFLLSVLYSTPDHIALKYKCPNYWYVRIWDVDFSGQA